jgi:hypothetical protein
MPRRVELDTMQPASIAASTQHVCTRISVWCAGFATSDVIRHAAMPQDPAAASDWENRDDSCGVKSLEFCHGK